MPIYEYRCEACGHYLDALQKISDAPLTDCPECDESALKRLISAPAFRLKGSGWYETDFKSDKDKRRNLAESGEAAKGDGAKGDAAKGDGAKGDGTKSDGAKGDGAKGDARKAGDATARDSSKSDSPSRGSKKPSDGSSKRPGSGNEAA